MKFKWVTLIFLISTGATGGFKLKTPAKLTYDTFLDHDHEGEGVLSSIGHILDQYPYLVLLGMAVTAFVTVIFTMCISLCLHKCCSKCKCKALQPRPVPKPRLEIYRRRTNSF